MGNIFSRSKGQQEKNVEEVIRAIVETFVIAMVIRLDLAEGLRTAFGLEVTIGITLVFMHLMWEELGEPFSGAIKWISGIFV